VSELPPPAAVLPHGGAAILLRRLVRATADELHAVARLPAESPYARGAFRGAALLEAAAQAAAAHGALAAAPREGAAPPSPGRLVGVKAARLAAEPPLDLDLEIVVQRVGAAGPLAIYTSRVTVAGAELLSAELSVWSVKGGPTG